MLHFPMFLAQKSQHLALRAHCLIDVYVFLPESKPAGQSRLNGAMMEQVSIWLGRARDGRLAAARSPHVMNHYHDLAHSVTCKALPRTFT